MSKQDLERDSGFSDASSEYLSTVEVTDSEDAGRNESVVGHEPGGQQVAVMGGSYSGLSPMIIMNNFVLKQPSSLAPPEKQWGFPSSVEVMPQSQVVLLKPVVLNGSNCSPKAGSDNTQQSKSYTPILKSYPRIAPYPVDTPSKKVGSSIANGRMGYEQHQRRPHDPQRLDVSPSPQSALHISAQAVSSFEAATSEAQIIESQEQDSNKSLASDETSSLMNYTYEELRTVPDDNSSSSLLTEKYQDPISIHSNKLKRFSNTYNILSKSGLLGITLRTKQLIKENKRTQGQLHLLQEQTALLLEALSSGDPQLWTKLQLSLQDTEREHFQVKAQRVLA